MVFDEVGGIWTDTETPDPPVITSASALSVPAGTDESFQVTSTGVPTPTLTESGSLPSGVTFTPDGDGSATIAGVPAVVGSANFPIAITASNRHAPPVTQDFVRPPPLRRRFLASRRQ